MVDYDFNKAYVREIKEDKVCCKQNYPKVSTKVWCFNTFILAKLSLKLLPLSQKHYFQNLKDESTTE